MDDGENDLNINDYSTAYLVSNGKVVVDKKCAKENDLVKVITVPNEGYKLKNLKILKASDGITEVAYNASNNTFTMPAYEVTINAEFELIPEEKTITKTEEDTTVSVKGTFSQNPVLTITKTEAGNEGYNSLITLVKEDKIVIGSYDITITGGTYTGKIELTFTVGKQYEGETITIYHRLASGEKETKTAIVKDGKSSIEVNELSPFMLSINKKVEEKKDETPKTGNIEYIGIITTVLCILFLGILILKRRKM